jgi:hypothetical protein
MMLGALLKSYYVEKINVKPEDIYVVSVMPCTAKKFEITREEMKNGGVPNVDAVLTTRELASMIKEAGIDFLSLSDELFDNPLGMSTGAADIFGLTGGVMEAALRTVYELVTGREEDLLQCTVGWISGCSHEYGRWRHPHCDEWTESRLGSGFTPPHRRAGWCALSDRQPNEPQNENSRRLGPNHRAELVARVVRHDSAIGHVTSQ